MSRVPLTEMGQARERIREALTGLVSDAAESADPTRTALLAALGVLTEAVLLLGEVAECWAVGMLASSELQLGAIERIDTRLDQLRAQLALTRQ